MSRSGTGTTSKPSRTSKRTTESTPAPYPPTNGERERLIAEAAYYRALGRNFQGGDPLEDWLTAEQEIDARLQEQSPSR